jgi:two-component system sensor histidine kinase YesM
MKFKNPIVMIRNAGMQTKLILICTAIIVPVFLASVYLMINVRNSLQDYAISEMQAETDNVAARFASILSGAEGMADELAQSEGLMWYLATGTEISTVLPINSASVSSVRIYYEDAPINPDRYFVKADSDVIGSSWYERAAEQGNAFWYLSEQPTGDEENTAETTVNLELIKPIMTGEKLHAVAVLTVNPAEFKQAVGSVGYPVVFTMANGVVIYSSDDSEKPQNVMFVPAKDLGASVVSDNFFYGDDYTVTMPFRTAFSSSEFRIYITAPYSAITDESRNVTLIYVWYVGLCLILSVLISILLTGFFTRRINFLKNQMLKVTDGDFELTDEIKGNDEIYELYELLKQMVKAINKSNNETTKARLQAETFRLNTVEAEFKALASQINPHFLYNTLETIRMKAYSSNDKETADLLKVLGKYMRRSLAVKDGLVSLSSELEFTLNYLKLQYARFGDRVTYNIYAEPDREYKILPLIIQPLVENAYAHGVESVKEGGYILIAVKYAGENVIIEVTDNGTGMDEETLMNLRNKIETGDTSSGKSIGLTNVHMRIKKYFGDIYGMKIFSEKGKGTTIRLTLPREGVDNKPQTPFDRRLNTEDRRQNVEDIRLNPESSSESSPETKTPETKTPAESPKTPETLDTPDKNNENSDSDKR